MRTAYCVLRISGAGRLRRECVCVLRIAYCVFRGPAVSAVSAYVYWSQAHSLSQAKYTTHIRNTQYTEPLMCRYAIHSTQYTTLVTYPSCIADTQYAVRKLGHVPFVHCRYAIRSTHIGSRRYHCLALNTHLCLSIHIFQYTV